MRVYLAAFLLPVSSPPLRAGAVAVDGDRIAAVGPRDEVLGSVGDDAEVRDLGHAVIIPGLVNAHCHVELSWMSEDPPAGDDYMTWLRSVHRSDDPLFYAIIDSERAQPMGVASYLRIDPAHGVIEVGHINYSPAMQRTPAGTEAMYLMMRNAFHLGYRRYEWKCDALNKASCGAALRLGFQYEGTFRQARINKGRNRDTAWYSVIDKDWPQLQSAYEQWLDPSNFSDNGQQHKRLSLLTAAVVSH